MNAVWGTAAIQPSLQVIPTQVPDIDEDIPDDSSPQSFPGCTLLDSTPIFSTRNPPT